MAHSSLIYIYVLVSSLQYLTVSSIKLSESELKNFFDNEYDQNETHWCTKLQEANWDFESDLENSDAEEALVNVILQAAEYNKRIWGMYFKDISVDDYKDPDLKRKIMLAKMLGKSVLDNEKLAELTNITNSMMEIYSTGKICPYRNQNCDLSTEGLNLDPGINWLFSSSRDYKELSYAWKSWRDQTGAKMRDLFERYVNLSNEASVLNGYNDNSEEWLVLFESPDFIKLIDDLWLQVEPLYAELHKYVAHKLKVRYGDALDVSDGLLPAHVLGNMWAQEWTNIEDIVKPFPDAKAHNVTDALRRKGFTAVKMFETSDDFYKSLGLLPNDMSYDTDKGAIIERPKDGRQIVCHASAWDFCDRKNFRIKMCTNLNAEDFITIHHEMGHIQYFQLYKDQPVIYREGANPGFHEAIGDTIALSVDTPKHLHKIGLIDEYKDDYETSINALMSIALSKVAFLPYGLLLDKWRWDVFKGKVSMDNWNSHYWKYRKQYQRMKPPVERSEEDFDPGAKFHVAGDVQYISYFVAHITQFQFFKSLCIAAGEYDPKIKDKDLHKCDFYQSKAAGDRLRAGLSLGTSKHWSVAMKAITGQEKMDAGPLLEYFEPLYQYLKTYNQAHNSTN
ncbi:angiotensin-converting enzyme-like [Coccinella septempunctata]|uniref:angiotensin-converting enzyme-like n=1 Tax=Coccinella septempunctata TaxID=41139 RepID=UPI001D064DD2|nr:angiotensin-converting enzyme-like [Coccinella septempunctata]